MVAHRTRLRRIALRHQLYVATFGFGLVVEKCREAVEGLPVQVEIAVVAPIARVIRFVVFSEYGTIKNPMSAPDGSLVDETKKERREHDLHTQHDKRECSDVVLGQRNDCSPALDPPEDHIAEIDSPD